MKQKLLAILLIVTMLTVLLAACNGDSTPSAPVVDTTESTPATTDSAADEPVTDEPAAASDERPVIYYWDVPYGPEETYRPAARAMVEKYNNENRAAIVEYQEVGWDGWYTTFMTAVMSGAAPDVSTGGYGSPTQFAAMGEALDLTPIFDKWRAENNPILDDFLPGFLELHVYEGKNVAIPFNADPRGVYYRADIIEDELGFTGLDGVVTWDDLLEICAAIQEAYGDEMYPMAFTMTGGGAFHSIINFMLSNACNWSNTTGTGAAYDDPKVLETLEYVAHLFDMGYVPPGMASHDGDQVQMLYASGNVAIVWQWMPAFLFDNEEMLAKTKVMGGIQGYSADQPRLNVWMNGIMGYSQTNYPEESKDFLEWLPFNYLTLSVDGGSNALPARLSFMEDQYFETDWLRSQFARNTPWYVNPVWPSPEVPPAFGQVEGDGSIGRPFEALGAGSRDHLADLMFAHEQINNAFAAFAAGE